MKILSLSLKAMLLCIITCISAMEEENKLCVFCKEPIEIEAEEFSNKEIVALNPCVYWKFDNAYHRDCYKIVEPAFAGPYKFISGYEKDKNEINYRLFGLFQKVQEDIGADQTMLEFIQKDIRKLISIFDKHFNQLLDEKNNYYPY